MRLILKAWLMLCLFAGPAAALSPHELALLVNADDEDSRMLAALYAGLRGVPAENIVELAAGAARHDISAEEFVELIYQPAWRVLEERGVAAHIAAWVYSSGFPVRVTTDPAVSITGFTFVRTKLPEARAVSDGMWRSPLFIGPEAPDGNILFAKSFDSYRRWLADEMPLPSMLLGVTLPHGNTPAELERMLRRAVESDATHPSGNIYLVQGEDIRARCRQWQFGLLERPLRRAGVALSTGSAMPGAGEPVMGLMLGTAHVTDGGWKLLPGAYAEHLTSHAGEFSHGGQTKLSFWLRNGAAGSSGTVIEPLSNWRKFPAASLFSAYTSGCTMIESIYQAVRCPLQLLPVGDPLAAPWRPAVQAGMTGVPAETVSGGTHKVELQVTGKGAGRYLEGRFLLNGRLYADGMTCVVEAGALAAGSHRLRGVAWQSDLVSAPVFVEKVFTVER